MFWKKKTLNVIGMSLHQRFEFGTVGLQKENIGLGFFHYEGKSVKAFR